MSWYDEIAQTVNRYFKKHGYDEDVLNKDIIDDAFNRPLTQNLPTLHPCLTLKYIPCLTHKHISSANTSNIYIYFHVPGTPAITSHMVMRVAMRNGYANIALVNTYMVEQFLAQVKRERKTDGRRGLMDI